MGKVSLDVSQNFLVVSPGKAYDASSSSCGASSGPVPWRPERTESSRTASGQRCARREILGADLASAQAFGGIEAEEGCDATSWRPRCRRDSGATSTWRPDMEAWANATATWRPEAAAWAKERRPESSGCSGNEQEERQTCGKTTATWRPEAAAWASWRSECWRSSGVTATPWRPAAGAWAKEWRPESGEATAERNEQEESAAQRSWQQRHLWQPREGNKQEENATERRW